MGDEKRLGIKHWKEGCVAKKKRGGVDYPLPAGFYFVDLWLELENTLRYNAY